MIISAVLSDSNTMLDLTLKPTSKKCNIVIIV